jgi:hypothetical protein
MMFYRMSHFLKPHFPATPHFVVILEWAISRIFDISYIQITPWDEVILEDGRFGTVDIYGSDQKILY